MIEESKIREKAYQLWENDGRPDGSAESFWFRALEELEAQDQLSSVQTAGPGSSETADTGAASPKASTEAPGQRTPVTVAGQGSQSVDTQPTDTDRPAKDGDGPLGDA
jgi:hypothetical protein